MQGEEAACSWCVGAHRRLLRPRKEAGGKQQGFVESVKDRWRVVAGCGVSGMCGSDDSHVRRRPAGKARGASRWPTRVSCRQTKLSEQRLAGRGDDGIHDRVSQDGLPNLGRGCKSAREGVLEGLKQGSGRICGGQRQHKDRCTRWQYHLIVVLQQASGVVVLRRLTCGVAAVCRGSCTRRRLFYNNPGRGCGGRDVRARVRWGARARRGLIWRYAEDAIGR